MRVGVAIPGEWYCNHCQRGGCWPARLHCFRCGMARGDGGFGKGGKAKGKAGAPLRETSYPGRSPPPAARTQAGKGWSVPVSISPDVVSQLLNLHQSLGVSQQVMGEIRSKDFASFSESQGSSCSYSRGCSIGGEVAKVCQSLGKPSRADDEERARLSCKHVAV